jgi:hypothetical protein
MVSDRALLTALRSDAPQRQPNVRVLAAFAEHADCNLASRGFALGVDFDQLLAGTDFAVPVGQSPFAFARGTRFEQSLREGGYGPLLDLLRRQMGFAVVDARVINLREGYPPSRYGMRLRAQATRRHIDAMLRDDPRAPNLIDGAVFETSLSGVRAYFEADAVAARSRGPIRVGEVKSFPVVDDRADPEKLGTALDQASHYIVLARQVAADLGHDPAAILAEAMLITPRNVGLQPTLSIKDVAGRVRRVERLLARVPSLAGLAGLVPRGITFGSVADRRPQDLRRANLPIPMHPRGAAWLVHDIAALDNGAALVTLKLTTSRDNGPMPTVGDRTFFSVHHTDGDWMPVLPPMPPWPHRPREPQAPFASLEEGAS